MVMSVNDKRIEYIQIATRILEEEGIGALSIRRVAKEAGCTSAVLYRHFENKDHLLMLASVKFLIPYIQELMFQSARTDISSIQIDLILWKKFIDEAFQNRVYYDQLFFGDQKEMLSECIYEYYSLFPDENEKFDGYTASIVMNSNLHERELIRLRRAANEKLITLDNAKLLSRLTTAVFNGMFKQVPAMKYDEVSLQMMADECYDLIYQLFKRMVKPGTKLDIEE